MRGPIFIACIALFIVLIHATPQISSSQLSDEDTTPSITLGFDNNSTNASSSAEVLVNATPGEILKLNLDDYTTTSKGLEELSSKDLAIALSKINSAYGVIPLANITSQDISPLLAKLSPEDLAIALTYRFNEDDFDRGNNAINMLDRNDIASLLNKFSPDDIMIALSKLDPNDVSVGLRSLSPDNLTRIMNVVSPEVARETGGYKTILNALAYSTSLDLLSKQPPENLTRLLRQFDSNTIKDVLAIIPPVTGGILLSSLANDSTVSYGSFISPNSMVEMSAPASPSSAPGPSSPGLDIAPMFHAILLKATIDEIKQMPLSEYSIDVIAKIMSLAPPLPEDKRNLLERVMTTYENSSQTLEPRSIE